MESSEVMVESFLDGVEITQGIYKTKEKVGSIPHHRSGYKQRVFRL